MLRALFQGFVCSVILIGKIQAQEVIVAREKQPEPLRQTPEAPKQAVQPSEELPSETPVPTRRKSKSHEKKSAPASLTLEEMRAAGGRAAGGLNSQSTKMREPEAENTPAPNPTVAATPRSVKRETPLERRSSALPRSTNLDGIGPIRPTMIESGREPPSPSPSGR